MRISIAQLSGVALVLVVAACGGGDPPPPPPPVVNQDSIDAAARRRADSIAAEQARADSIRRAREQEEAARAAAEAERIRATTAELRTRLESMVHYDYDKADIRPADARLLDEKLAILRTNAGLRVEIAGHCDDRGSDEYNLALGNRRALAAKQYLVDRGIAENRITTVSYGEERPLDNAMNEGAWARNRRGEFRVTAGGQQINRPAGM